jgi:hypothetical protein
MSLEKLINDRKPAVLSRWFDLSIASYPEETVQFLKSKKNRFANPVGYILSQELTPILEGLLQGVAVESMGPYLDNIIRIRAVQDFAPSRALNFVFSLKEVLREVLEEEIRENRLEQELLEIESRIDALALLAFDIFVQCREKIYELKSGELSRRTVGLMKRAGLIVGDSPEADPAET